MGRHAALQETDDLVRELAEIDEDALLRLERLEPLLADFQGVQQKQVVFTGQMDAQDLQYIHFSTYWNVANLTKPSLR